MMDVTEALNRYRETARHLWNAGIGTSAEQDKSWDTHDAFEDICVLLFSVMVLHPAGRMTERKAPGYTRSPEPLHFLKVVPRVDHGVPVMINREVPACGYWDYPVTQLRPEDAELRFIDSFDWEKLGQLELRYHRVRIIGSSTHPEIVDRDALIEASHARVVVLDD